MVASATATAPPASSNDAVTSGVASVVSSLQGTPTHPGRASHEAALQQGSPVIAHCAMALCAPLPGPAGNASLAPEQPVAPARARIPGHLVIARAHSMILAWWRLGPDVLTSLTFEGYARAGEPSSAAFGRRLRCPPPRSVGKKARSQLASVLLSLDDRIFSDVAVGWHLHSIAWYLALVVAVAGLYRRVLPRATATIATLLFAVCQ
jgi:hypothetical protein